MANVFNLGSGSDTNKKFTRTNLRVWLKLRNSQNPINQPKWCLCEIILTTRTQIFNKKIYLHNTHNQLAPPWSLVLFVYQNHQICSMDKNWIVLWIAKKSKILYFVTVQTHVYSDKKETVVIHITVRKIPVKIHCDLCRFQRQLDKWKKFEICHVLPPDIFTVKI